MAQATSYGKQVKYRLIDLGQKQEWLIQRVKEETGLYFDSSYMYKIQTGQLSSPKIIEAINKILEIDCEGNTNG